MGRIRTIKPEFWEDEVIGTVSREARLTFLATLNLADDEGILRWTNSYIKSSVFIYDEDVSVENVGAYMTELEEAGLVFAYCGGKAKQRLAFIVSFRRHQVINRPSPSKLPAPSLQSNEVRLMYARREKYVCQLCKSGIPEHPSDNDSLNLSIDHIVAQASGGSDFPSNIQATHQGCSKAKKHNPVTDFVKPRSVKYSVNESQTNSPTEGKGKGKGKEEEKELSVITPEMISRGVLSELSLSGRDLAVALDEVCRAEVKKGRDATELRDAMIESWRLYDVSKPSLTYTKGAAKFFGDGDWRNKVGWPWKPGSQPDEVKPVTAAEKMRRQT